MIAKKKKHCEKDILGRNGEIRTINIHSFQMASLLIPVG